MSILKKANSLYKRGLYSESVSLYEKFVAENPSLKKFVELNIQLAKKRNNSLTPEKQNLQLKKIPVTALVITWDVGHNCLGRAYLLAEVLERIVDNVVLCGFQFQKRSNDVWEPLRQGDIPVITIKAESMQDWIAACERVVEKFRPDIVFASKPRLPSVQLGMLFKKKYNIPLVIDVDDYELSFVGDASPIDLDGFKAIDESKVRDEIYPYGKIWTQLTETLAVDNADLILTSNLALQKKYGGVVIPHVRDEMSFDPHFFDKFDVRKQYQVPLDIKVIMFFGTVRKHKGVEEVAQAVGELGSDVYLIVVGESEKNLLDRLDQLSYGKFISLGKQPFEAIPEILAMADLVVLPQDLSHSISHYQLPAKAIDAIAMSVPLLVSGTEPLKMLVADGVAKDISGVDLASAIKEELFAIRDEEEFIARREVYLEKYSYSSAASKLYPLLNKLLAQDPKKLTSDFFEMQGIQNKLFPSRRSVGEQYDKKAVDVVLFWNQNDSGLYDSRCDMLSKYLSKRKDIKRVIVFDVPVTTDYINKLKSGGALTQGRDIYIKTLQKKFGAHDSEKVSYHGFIYRASDYSETEGQERLLSDYMSYLDSVFVKLDVDPQRSIFWLDLELRFGEKIIERFKPEKIVADVIEEHQAWSYIIDNENEALTDIAEPILHLLASN